MRRTVLASADLSGDALDELKQWLGISRSNEDANLTTLLMASLDLCESFLGQRPLEAECEELVDVQGNSLELTTLPVKAIIGLEEIAPDGQRTPVAQTDYSASILADGSGQITLATLVTSKRVAIRFTAGIASDWAALPGALRHGIIRLAAFHYRERDSAKTLPPPASVTALWRPWRRMRLT